MRLTVKCRADVAQQVDVGRAGSSQSALSTMIASVGPSPKVRKCSKTLRMRRDIRLDFVVGEELAAFVLARGVADLGRPAAHQDDRLVPGLLKPAQHHDLDQAADMERRRSGIEPDVARHDLACRASASRPAASVAWWM